MNMSKKLNQLETIFLRVNHWIEVGVTKLETGQNYGMSWEALLLWIWTCMCYLGIWILFLGVLSVFFRCWPKLNKILWPWNAGKGGYCTAGFSSTLFSGIMIWGFYLSRNITKFLWHVDKTPLCICMAWDY